MSLHASVLSGTRWMIALRWVNRLLGIASVAVLARFLEPADFGLVAMASLAVGLVDVWMQWGLENAVVQSRSTQRELLDTAWTLRVLQGLLVAGAVAAAGPIAAAYFNEPRVTHIMWALAPGIAVAGAANIGVVLFRKELNFRAEFMLQFSARVIQIGSGIAAAIAFRSYWALVVGTLAGYVATFLLSYILHPFRPRWTLSAWRELWSFSAWTLVANISYFAETKADELVVGRVGTARDMGLYSVSSDLGQSASLEIAAPLGRVLFPAFSKMQDDAERLAASFSRAFEALVILIVPAGVGLALVASEAVELLLGPKWPDAAPFVAILAIYGVIRSAVAPVSSMLLALGRPKVLALISWSGVVLFVAIVAAMGSRYGIVGIAFAKLAAGLFITVISLWCLTTVIPLRLNALLLPLLRVVLSAGVMAIAVQHVPPTGLGVVFHVMVKIVVGAAVYTTATLVWWFWRGKPVGLERSALSYAKGLIVRDGGA